MYETEQQREKAVLIAVEDERHEDADGCLNELELLADTAGADTVGKLVQRREAVHPGHYLGKGKMDELKALVTAAGADSVIADDELTAAQQRNMSQMLGVPVLDRTLVILDIFAARASSAEGRAQVELAQLRYRQSHLTGLGTQLSRQAGGGGFHGGGIGTRGPGEKKLETDRRHIRSRVDQLNRELKDIREGRATLRKRRLKNGVPVAALVGYTNAGKSTLMNALTGAGVLAEDKLFATLDTTTRKAVIPTGDTSTEVLFTDTVGFIHKLPHQLIQAFRATLEELAYADVLLHVVDYSATNYGDQIRVVLETVKELGCGDKPIITVFNKTDLLTDAPVPASNGRTAYISARTGEGLPDMLQSLTELLKSMRTKISLLIPYSQGKLVNTLHQYGEIIMEEHRPEGTYIEAYADSQTAGRLEEFIVKIA
jgi:GTP-binding protein HflX